MRRKYYLYSGLLAILAEWAGFVLIAYFHHLDLNKALSVNTVASWPLPLIFGITLTLAGLGYGLFSVALKPYAHSIIYVGITAGVAFAFTGWTPYTGYGGVGDLVHQAFSYVALAGYITMVWLLRSHPKRQIRLASKIIVGLMLAIIALAPVSNYVWHQGFGYLQIAIVGLFQSWVVLVVWQERKLTAMDKIA
ncbi:MAG: hypothetical protein ABIQ89_01165 [Candidatus Saccharimonadales bacterium]